MNKIIMSLGICLLMSMALVSSATVSNIETNYDKKSKTITFDYDLTLNNECSGSVLNILDHKGNIIATNIVPWKPGNPMVISCIIQNGVVLWGGKTGTTL